MEYIKLKNSDITVSRLCMGGCPMGGHGWGNVQEADLVEAVHTALDNGITFFDTADTYGLGQSELTLGKALGHHRKDVVIASKFGVRVGNGKTTYDNSPKWIKEALRLSLKRLGTDYIDLYQVHYRDGITPISDVVETLEELKDKGLIRAYGLSNLYLKDSEELKGYENRFVSFQNEYSLACRKYEEDILSLSKSFDMTPFTWGSLGQGILTGKYDKDTVFESNDRRSRDIYINFHGEKLLRNLEIVEVMKGIAAKYEKSIPAVAIRFILDKLANSVVIAGAKNPKQILSNVDAADWKLSQEDIMLLDKISKQLS